MSEWQPAPLQEMNMDLEEKIARAINRSQSDDDEDAAEQWRWPHIRHNRTLDARSVLSCLEENGMGELAKLERLVRIADEALRQAPFECGEKWRKEYTDYLTNKAMAELAAAPKG
jgi:hypothetical protein